MQLAIGSDHAGYLLKRHLRAWLEAEGHEIEDCGAFSEESVDYPLQAEKVAGKVARGEVDAGLLICGTGIGMAIAANKVHGVRAACCFDPVVARLARAHNDANILTLGSRILGTSMAEAILEAFLETEFDGDRHQRRVSQIHDLES